MNPYVRTIHYYETDKMGLTHHSNYVRIMEEARIDLLEQIDWSYAKLESEGIISPVLNINCDFKKSTTFPDEIKVEMKVIKIGGCKITFEYTFFVEGTIVFSATSTHGFLDKTGRPIIIEKKYPDLFNKMKLLVKDCDEKMNII